MNLESNHEHQFFSSENLNHCKYSGSFQNSQMNTSDISNIIESYTRLMDKYNSAGHECYVD